jgi:cell division protein FtsN
MFLGVIIGLVMGLMVAAGLAWYFYAKPSEFKTVPQAPAIEPLDTGPVAAAPAPGPVADKPTASKPTPRDPAPAASAPAPRATTAPAAPPARPAQGEPAPGQSNYTFFDILPGEKPSKPTEPKLDREVWWLQVAALSEAKDADRLKARLALLGLEVQVQKVASGATTLNRVRVGPFKTEDEALGALDTLAVNNYEPRLFKEKSTNP